MEREIGKPGQITRSGEEKGGGPTNIATNLKESGTDSTKYVHFGGQSRFFPDHENCKWCRPTPVSCLGRCFKQNVSPNYISSTNYTLLNFFPLAFLQQFKRKANIYFILLFLITLTKYSPRNPFLSIVPIVVIFSVSFIKEAYEFYQRHEDDKNENESISLIYNYENNTWKTINREDIKEGDILLIRKNESVPADVALLQSSLESGLCSIKTTNLDGETNLKMKRSIEKFKIFNVDEKGIDSALFIDGVSGFVESEAANSRMSANIWKGVLFYKTSDGSPGEEVSMDKSQFLMRGCVLKNTDWILCITLFTGSETKIEMQNNKKTKIKDSSIDKMINNIIYIVVTMEAIAISTGAILNYWFYSKNKLWYFNGNVPTKVDYFLSIFSFLSILESAIPISLYVVMELGKVVQALNINRDPNMYDYENKAYANTRISNLTDELGRVGIAFCDKTGTLTQNKMVFSRCCIYGEKFLVDSTDKNSVDEKLREKVKNGDKKCNEFMALLASCHTAIPEPQKCYLEHEHGIDCEFDVTYQVESPDEQCLLEFAKNHGYIFKERVYKTEMVFGTLTNIEYLKVEVNGRIQDFKLYNIFEFDSERKRMSVVVELQDKEEMLIFTKGAESEIFKILSEESRLNDVENITKHLLSFCNKGLRTLVCATREIPREEFKTWWKQYAVAKKRVNRDEEEIYSLVTKLENNLRLIGLTGVEDRLQDEVPETLQLLADAGISVWILTGDKTQTVLNIVKSCNLLTEEMFCYPNMVLLDVNENQNNEIALDNYQKTLNDTWEKLKNKDNNSPDQAMVINGRALELIFPMRINKTRPPDFLKEYQKTLVEIMMKCRIVICCRISPFQKSQVVDLYKKANSSKITLAIGDGANDVPMLKKSHVSVGIMGREGRQASRSADFSIGQFKFIKSLTLYHGANNYSRIAKMVNFCFYKNLSVVVCMYMYIFYDGYSSTLIMPQDALTFINLIFTNVPIFIVTTFDILYTRQTAYKYPFLYKKGPKNDMLNIRSSLKYLLRAVVQGLVVFYVHYFLFDEEYVGRDGMGNPVCYLSYSLFHCMLTVITFETLFVVGKFNYYVFGSFLYTVPNWIMFSYMFAYQRSLIEDNYGCIDNYIREPYTWILVFICTCVCCLPHLIYRFIKYFNCPSRLDIVNEINEIKYEKKSEPKKRKKKIMRFLIRNDSTLGHAEYYAEPQRKSRGPRWLNFRRTKHEFPTNNDK